MSVRHAASADLSCGPILTDARRRLGAMSYALISAVTQSRSADAMYEGLSTREIVGWIASLVVAAGLIVLGAVYLVNSDLTADVSHAHSTIGSSKAKASH